MNAKFLEITVMACLAVLPACVATTALAAPTPALSCAAAKDKAAGKDIQCRTAAYGKAADLAALNEALAKCSDKANQSFVKVDGKYLADCPTSSDGAAVDDFAAAVSRQLGAYLSGAAEELGCELLPPAPVFEPKGAARSCIAGKTKAAASAVACRMKAHSSFAKKGDSVALGDALADCSMYLGERFDEVEAKYPGACPVENDATLVALFIADQTGPLATYLASASPLPECDPPFCGDGTIDDDEDCDGAALGGATCDSVTAGALELGTLACSSVCEFDTAGCSEVPCGNGVIDDGEDCDGAQLGGATCSSETSGTLELGALACSSACEFDTAGCSEELCGNDEIDAPEECDGAALGGATCSSVTSGALPLGSLACNASCLLDTAGCVADPCGNGVIDDGEDCDGSALGGATCDSATGGALELGALACNSACEFDTAGCSENLCGNGVIDMGEECDGTNLGGNDKCRDVLGIGYAGYLTCDSSCEASTGPCTAVAALAVTVFHTQLSNGNPTVPQTTEMVDPELMRLNFVNYLTATPTNLLAAGFYPGDPDLLYHWVVRSTNKPDGYSDAGMSGYHAPVFTIQRNAMISGEDETYIVLNVTSATTGLDTIVTLNLAVQQSALALTLFDTCQASTMTCTDEGCCTIAAALPATEPY